MVEAIIEVIFTQYSPQARITTASRIKHRLHLPQPQPHSLRLVPVLGADVPDVIPPVHHSSLPQLPSGLIPIFHSFTLPPPPMLDFVLSNTEHTPTTPVFQCLRFGPPAERERFRGEAGKADAQRAQMSCTRKSRCPTWIYALVLQCRAQVCCLKTPH